MLWLGALCITLEKRVCVELLMVHLITVAWCLSKDWLRIKHIWECQHVHIASSCFIIYTQLLYLQLTVYACSVPASACIVFLRGNPTISLFCPPLINRYSFHLSQMLIDRMGKTQIFYVTAGQTKKKKLIMMSDALCRRGNKIPHACRKKLHSMHFGNFFPKKLPKYFLGKKTNIIMWY